MKHRWQYIRYDATGPKNNVTITRLKSTFSWFCGVPWLGVNLLVVWEGMCCLIRLWHTYIFKFEWPFCFLWMAHRWQAHNDVTVTRLQAPGCNCHRRGFSYCVKNCKYKRRHEFLGFWTTIKGQGIRHCHLCSNRIASNGLDQSQYTYRFVSFCIEFVWTNDRPTK
jgi:hypothetical protein